MDTFDWRQPLVEYDLWWKMTFKGELLLETFLNSALPYTAIAVIFKEDHPWNFFNHSTSYFIQKKWLWVNWTALWALSSCAKESLVSFFQHNPMIFSINVIMDPKFCHTQIQLEFWNQAQIWWEPEATNQPAPWFCIEAQIWCEPKWDMK